MATVRQLVDALAAGTLSVDMVVQDFSRREWPNPRKLSGTQNLDESPAPDDNSFDVVSESGRLTPTQYRKLAAAYERAVSAD